jgi:hypothetical protein
VGPSIQVLPILAFDPTNIESTFLVHPRLVRGIVGVVDPRRGI